MSRFTRADLTRILGFDPSEEQWQAISAPLGPQVIIAGAGSGKTTVMAARVLWLIATGQVHPRAVLGLTFTTKATGELLARVRHVVAQLGLDPDAAADPTVQTYHAFAEGLLRDHGLRVGAEPDASLILDGARHQLAYRVIVDTDLDLSAVDRRPQDVVSAVLRLDSDLVERCLDIDVVRRADEDLLALLPTLKEGARATTRDMLATARERLALLGLVEQFRAAKQREGVRDFTDQMRLVTQVATQRPEVGQMLREQFAIVMLDEYQDTSIAQRTFLRALFGDGHPVTAVGDPFQAIYGWRGASVHNITGFADHFSAATSGHAHVVAPFALTANRRSTPRILNAANDIAASLRDAHPAVPPLAPARTSREETWRIALHATIEDEVVWVGAQVERLWHLVMDEITRGVREPNRSPVAVLAREQADLAHVAAELDRRQVPYEVVGVEHLFSQPIINDILATLEVVHDPTRNDAMIRLLSSPRWAIGPRDLALLGQRAQMLSDGGRRRGDHRDLPGEERITASLQEATAGQDAAEVVALVDALEDLGAPSGNPKDGQVGWDYSPEARERMTALAQELRTLRQASGASLQDLVVRIAHATGVWSEAAVAGDIAAARAMAALHQFLDLVAVHEQQVGPGALGSLLAYIRDVTRFKVQPRAQRDGLDTAVRLMTVHAAKGLEFPAVVLPFLVDGEFPNRQGRPRWPTNASVAHAWLDDEPLPPEIATFPDRNTGPRAKDHEAFKRASRELDLLDETRLAYVAVTRAEDHLVASGHRWGRTQQQPRGLSDYLDTLRQHATPHEIDVWEPEPDAGAANPLLTRALEPVAWPATPDPQWQARRRAAADLMVAAAEQVRTGAARDPDGLTPAERQLLAEWDNDIAALEAEHERATSNVRYVQLPASLTTSALMDLAADPQRFARRLARPMPRVIGAAAERGTAFHAWVEQRWGAQVAVFDESELLSAADADLTDADLDELKAAFERGPFANERPHQVEVPFTLPLGAVPIRGRIDAVFRRGDRWLVVDWKTSARDEADPLQLAVYRLAWAALEGVDPDLVDAAFHFVRSGTTTQIEVLPDAAELAAQMAL